MAFQDSTYSVFFKSEDSSKKEFEKQFDEANIPLRFKREKAFNYFMELINLEKTLTSSAECTIEFRLLSHYIQPDLDGNIMRDFECFETVPIFIYKNGSLSINFHNWQRETGWATSSKEVMFNKLVKTLNDKNEIVEVYDDKVCLALNIKFEYFEWD